MKPMRSLRSRIIAGMVVLIALVFGIAVLGVTSIRSLRSCVSLTRSTVSVRFNTGVSAARATTRPRAAAITMPPAERMRRAPSTPSSPMPVKITPTARRPAARAALAKSRSALGT